MLLSAPRSEARVMSSLSCSPALLSAGDLPRASRAPPPVSPGLTAALEMGRVDEVGCSGALEEALLVADSLFASCEKEKKSLGEPIVQI